ncbi:MAG TPA: response regulator transcription factor [Planctomycetota bacterium]|jgi:DNA-binding response OmpR family regulator
MTQRQVLVVEDDSAIRQGICDALKFHGFAVQEAKSGNIGLEMAVRGDYDLLLLDLILPERDGLEILREVRSVRPATPVIILTAKGDESDRVQGLKLGADDYVVKPFSVKELLARVEAVLRRSPERPVDVAKVTLPCGTADLARREIRYTDGKREELSERETELLRHLAANPGRVITRDEILLRVWRIDPSKVETRTIDMHVARLREKLRDNSNEPKVLLTVRGKGYMFGTEKSGV